MAAGEESEDRGGEVSRETWKWSALAGMASYLDAGSIVALGAGLALFQEELGLSATRPSGCSPPSARTPRGALGAFVGGRLGDRLGRKRIYQ